MIDIFSIEPNKISEDLKGKFIMIYGQPKVGKTSFASEFPKALLCAFEVGYHALPGIKAANIDSWSTFKKIVQQLKMPKAKEMYDTIVIDTVSIATELCEKFVLAQNDVSSLGDIPWGQGWSIYKKEFDTPFRELSQLGYGIVFIAHSKDKPTDFTDKDGNAINSVFPDINKTGLNTVNRLVDVIAYLSAEFQKDGTTKRYLYTRQTPTIFAGSRYKYLESKIEFGYDQLVHAITAAIAKEVENGASTTSFTEIAPPPKRSYAEAMEEAKALWGKLASPDNAKREENIKKIRNSIKENFGKEMQLSEIKEDQLELYEIVISDMRAM